MSTMQKGCHFMEMSQHFCPSLSECKMLLLHRCWALCDNDIINSNSVKRSNVNYCWWEWHWLTYVQIIALIRVTWWRNKRATIVRIDGDMLFKGKINTKTRAYVRFFVKFKGMCTKKFRWSEYFRFFTLSDCTSRKKLTGRVKIDQQKESHWAATEIDIQCFIFGIGCFIKI